MYNYSEQRGHIFTDEGQRDFLLVRDHVQYLLKIAGAFQMLHGVESLGTCDTWTAMAYIDRLVELGEIKEITPPDCAGQNRTFVKR